MRLHYWNTRLSAAGMIEKRRDVMKPPLAKTESDIAGNVEAWYREVMEIEKSETDEYLPVKYKMAAMKGILTGGCKKWFERKEYEFANKLNQISMEPGTSKEDK